MALIKRVSRLFRADLHAVLDQLEEPDVLLRQAIREMEQSLTDEKRQLRKLQQRSERLDARAQEITETLDGVEQELNLCLENGAESLARSLIRRKLEHREILKTLNARKTEAQRSADRLQHRIDNNRIRLEQTRQQAELAVREQEASEAEYHPGMPEPLVPEQQVEIALLHEKQKRGIS